MKRSELKSKIRRSRLAHSGLALLLALSTAAALILPGYNTLSEAGAANEGDTSMSEDDNDLLASFNFSGSDRLEDLSGNGVIATLVDDENIIGTENGNNYLDLTKSDAYLSLEGSTLSGLTGMTVEMRVLTKDTETNWAFFAAPNGNDPGNDPTYLGVLLKNQAKIERFADGREHDDDFYGNWTVNVWHTIRVVFEENSTTLYIDDNAPVVRDSTKKLETCLGNNGIIWFGHAPWSGGEGFNGYIDDISIWNTADPDRLIDSNLIVSLTFEGEGNAILTDKSENGHNATLVGRTADNSDLFIPETGGSTYLDLTNRKVYLSLTNADSVLNGLEEMTVELQVKTDDISGQVNWPFFAAPDGEPPHLDIDDDNGVYYFGEHYLGIILNDSATVERYANNGARPTNPCIAEWKADGKWHRIKVVFKESSTILCVDNEVVSIGTNYSLADCLGIKQDDGSYSYDDSILWFGHSSWGEYFNGCIDYIKIWGHATYDPINEDDFIVKDSVSDPKNTTVNMFDYWITDQYTNDYEALDGTDHDKLFQGINKDHLLLFAGEQAFSGGPKLQATADEIGFWNRSTGGIVDGVLATTNEITQGIVRNTLEDGYPKLALDALAASTGYIPSDELLGDLKRLWGIDDKKTESLDYLFDPAKNVAGKASYPNVTGLFQKKDNGYYEFHSWKTFAELNVEQGTGGKAPTGNNHITLYDRTWGWGMPWEHDGQFFPFNDWSDMFFINQLGEVEQAHQNYKTGDTYVDDDGETKDVYADGGVGQTYTDEPLNHYFGMTVETRFQQPVDGKLDGQIPMNFSFSGDDDVWIFIDDVLVGDLGGIHGWKAISIDFSTGKIFTEFALNKETGESVKDDFSDAKYKTTLADMFEAAKPGSTDDWNTTAQGDIIFPDNSVHTMKFFYLERGNQFSNCNITFNLQMLPEKTESKPGSGKTVKPGDTIDYEISWGNYTDAYATLTFTDELDDDVDFVSAGCGGITLEAQKDEDGKVTYVTTGNNSDVIIEYDEVNRTVTWKVKNAAPESDVKVFLKVEVTEDIEDGDIILNQAAVANSEIPDVEYKTDIIKNPVVDLDIVKTQAKGKYSEAPLTENPITVREGDSVTYYLTVTVKGTTDEVLEDYGLEELKSILLEDIVVEDMIPVGAGGVLDLNSDSIRPDTYDIISYDDSKIIKWSLGDRKVGEEIVLSYTVMIPHVDVSTTWKNIAYATSDYTKNGQPGYPDDPDRPRPWEASNDVEINDPVGNLKISKTVQDSHGYASDTEFEFTVKFFYDDSNPSGSSETSTELDIGYPYYDADGNLSGTVISGGTVKLSDGESITVKGLPVGTYYEITEKPSLGYNVGEAAKTASGSIKEIGETVSVGFVNIYNVGELKLTVSKEVVGRPWNTGETFTFELKPADQRTGNAIGSGITMPESNITLTESNFTKVFDAIRFTALSGEDDYKFIVSEVKGGASPDLVCDPTEYEVSVKVTGPDKNGDLIVAASYAVTENIKVESEKDKDGKENIAMGFTNTMKPVPAVIPVTKVIADENRGWREGDSFTFAITSVSASPDYKNAAQVVYPTDPITIAYGDISKTKAFEGIEFCSTGTYKFTVTEAKSNIPGMHDDTSHTVTVTVDVDKESGEPVITYKVDGKAMTDDGAVFTNTYKSAPLAVSLPLNVSKTLNGREEWIEDLDKFSFLLEGYDRDTLAAIEETGDISIAGGKTDTVVISKKGRKQSFGNITFNTAGTFTFKVTEIEGNNGSIAYDKTVYAVTVTVEDNYKEGKLEITDVSVKTEGGQSVYPNEDIYTLEFVNKYSASGSWPPKIAKELIGRPWTKDDKFVFTLELTGTPDGVEKSAVTMPESITVQGTVNSRDIVEKQFGEVGFTEPGIYTFKLSEKQPGADYDGGVIFDKGYYVLTVDVNDDGRGSLEVLLVGVTFFDDASGSGNGAAYEDTAYLFTNTYAASVSLTVPIEKELNYEGDSYMLWKEKDWKFVFTISPTDNSNVIIGENPVTLTADKRTGSFELTFKATGEYTFEITEANSNINDMTYADPYTLTVKVTDDMYGELTAECYIGEDESPVDLNKYSLIFVNKYEPTPPSGEDEPTDPPVTTPSSSSETYPPATSDNNFNFDDNGLPEGNQNLQTGVSLDGSAYIAVGALLLSAAALAVGKRRYSRKGK